MFVSRVLAIAFLQLYFVEEISGLLLTSYFFVCLFAVFVFSLFCFVFCFVCCFVFFLIYKNTVVT